MSRFLLALVLALSPFAVVPTAEAATNMDKCVFFSWTHVSDSPSIFSYRLTNYCKQRVYVQVCVADTKVCRAHYLGRAPRQVERTVQDPRKQGERMTFRAIAN
ncbi:MAG: hypothetical protein AAFR16_10705 [Pseudomonadota bacterium]